MLLGVLDGFLHTRATLMLDVVAMAMLVVTPVLAASIWLVKFRRHYALHRAIQLTLGITLLATVVLFELDMRLNGWRDRARPSPYFGEGGGIPWVDVALTIHLCFAVTAALLWVAVIVMALRGFDNPPTPGVHSRRHIFWGKLAAIDMLLTAVTGWIFYWLAFVAS